MKFGSLFSGFGGMDLGLEQSGMTCLWQVEFNKSCLRILEKNFPGIRRHEDVRTFPSSNPEDWNCDLIAGGDPCQENSRARSGIRTTQPRLGHEFIRVVEEIRPRFVLRENPSRVRSDAPWPWWRFRNELERIGYSVLPFRLRACCVGADHQRERLFLLAEMGNPDSIQPRFGGRIKFEKGGNQERNVDIWPDQSEPPRMVDGISDRVERLKGLGNALPPPMAKWIGLRIMNSLL